MYAELLVLSYLGVFNRQHITERWNNSLLDDIRYLFFTSTNGEITDGPGCLFLSLEITLCK